MAREQLTGAKAARGSAHQEVAALDAQVASIDDKLARSRIRSPLTGTVLARYVEAGEFVQAGQPLFKLASLDSLTFRAYVSNTQLTRLKLGPAGAGGRRPGGLDRHDAGPRHLDRVGRGVHADADPDARRARRPGLRDQDRVANPDGRLKIGMPGELTIASRCVQ